MNKRYKKILIAVSIMLVVSLCIGLTYAYYIFTASQEGNNIVRTACFKITFNDENDINITNGVPVRESDAESLVPYSFTIKNVCNYNMDYYINIETLNNSTIDLNAIRYKLDDDYSEILGDILNNDSSVYFNSNVLNSKTIGSGYLGPNDEKTHTLRIWVDENSTVEQSASKTYESKVVVSSEMRYEDIPGAILAKGPVLNARLKSLAGDINEYAGEFNEEEKRLCMEYACEFYLGKQLGNWNKLLNTDAYIGGKEVLQMVISDTPPGNDKETVVISSDDSKYEILAWVEDAPDSPYYSYIHLYAGGNQIYFNKDSSYAFAGFSTLEGLDLSQFNFELVENMKGMFYQVSSKSSGDLTLNFGENFNPKRVKNISGLFLGSGLTDVVNFNRLNNSKLEDISYLFYKSETYGESASLRGFDTSRVRNMAGLYYHKELLDGETESFDTSNVTNMSYMFDECTNSSLDVSNFNTSKVTDMSGMFHSMNNLQHINLSNFDTTNVTNFSNIFAYDSSLLEIDVTHFNTSKATNMSGMFSNLEKITSLDVSHFDTSNVTDMSEMFFSVKMVPSLNLSNFNTSKVKDMSYMFYWMTSLTSIDISAFNTSNVTNMNGMFGDLTSLTSLDVSTLNTSNVTNMSSMFSKLNVASLDVSNFDTSKVENMSLMFNELSTITSLDLSNFDTRNVTNTYEMFRDSTNLTTIYVGENWSMSNVSNSTAFLEGSVDMFKGLTNIVGGLGTTYDSTKTDKTYARVDCGPSTPGYLSYKGTVGYACSNT